MTELDLNKDTVQLLIDKAHEFHAGTDVTFPGDTEASGEWDDALRFAEETWTDHTADYSIGSSLPADYLQGGLEQLTTEER